MWCVNRATNWRIAALRRTALMVEPLGKQTMTVIRLTTSTRFDHYEA